jgi:hypothetical protein
MLQVHINQPHLADFDILQRSRAQYTPQVPDVVASKFCSNANRYMAVDENSPLAGVFSVIPEGLGVTLRVPRSFK